MRLEEFNALNDESAYEELIKCCGSSHWANQMLALRPFSNLETMLASATESWENCSESDAMEAFRHHPKIGSVAELEKKFASTAKWASGEQSAVKNADKKILQALAKGNDAYEHKFGYIFIVCATGKSAEEMLGLLEARLPNVSEIEIGIAMAEQMKITLIRLNKLIQE